MMDIDSFTGKYAFLSNFWPCTIKDLEFGGIVYPSVEHAYQAGKTCQSDTRKKIARLDTPGKAKRFGQTVELRWNWDEIKLILMKYYLQQKFYNTKLQHDIVGTYLLEDGEYKPAELIEGNTWGDTYWGICNGVGENHLGKLLMDVRHNIMMEIYCN